jgi:hypothetical protein
MILASALPSLAEKPNDEALEVGKPDVNAFSLKDGRVYRGETALDCEVNKVPDEIDGPIRYWSVLDPDSSDAVKENETGVWFFGGDGVFLTFVPDIAPLGEEGRENGKIEEREIEVEIPVLDA